MPLNSKVFNFSNRGIKYGDGFFESMRVFNSKIYFLEDHLKRVAQTAELLDLDLSTCNFNKQILENTLETYLKKHDKPNCAIRIQFFRKDGLKYTPNSANTEYFIEFSSTDENQYKKGVNINHLGVYEKHLLQKNCSLSSYKTSNSLIYILAKAYARKTNLDDIILLNTEQEVAEFSAANIFLDFGDKIITPPLSSGCLDGIIRRQLLKPELAMEFNISVDSIKQTDLFKAVAIYGTNTSSGVFYVKNLNDKSYSTGVSEKLLKLLQKTA